MTTMSQHTEEEMETKMDTDQRHTSGQYYLSDPSRPSQMPKKDWIRRYSQRILRMWAEHATSLGVARDYVNHIAGELASLYDDPLKRAFVEATY